MWDSEYLLLLPSVRAHTFGFLICSNLLLIWGNSFWKFAATISNLQHLYSFCSNFILFTATLFYLQLLCFKCSKVFLICCNFISLAASFNLQHFPRGPTYFHRDSENVGLQFVYFFFSMQTHGWVGFHTLDNSFFFRNFIFCRCVMYRG